MLILFTPSSAISPLLSKAAWLARPNVQQAQEFSKGGDFVSAQQHHHYFSEGPLRFRLLTRHHWRHAAVACILDKTAMAETIENVPKGPGTSPLPCFRWKHRCGISYGGLLNMIRFWISFSACSQPNTYLFLKIYVYMQQFGLWQTFHVSTYMRLPGFYAVSFPISAWSRRCDCLYCDVWVIHSWFYSSRSSPAWSFLRSHFSSLSLAPSPPARPPTIDFICL